MGLAARNSPTVLLSKGKISPRWPLAQSPRRPIANNSPRKYRVEPHRVSCDDTCCGSSRAPEASSTFRHQAGSRAPKRTSRQVYAAHASIVPRDADSASTRQTRRARTTSSQQSPPGHRVPLHLHRSGRTDGSSYGGGGVRTCSKESGAYEQLSKGGAADLAGVDERRLAREF